MKVEEYRSALHDDIAISAAANYSNEEEEFLNYVTGLLAEGEEFEDFTECYYEGISRRKAVMRIDGYAKDETDGSWCVVIADYHGPHGHEAILSDDITSSFKKAKYFVEEATKYEMYYGMEESTEAYEFARDLYYDKDNITKFRFYLLTDAFNRQRRKNIKDTEVSGIPVELNVWDISRIFDLVSSKTHKESVEISLKDFQLNGRPYGGIPCVKAVDCRNVVADIEIVPKYDEDIEQEDQTDALPENIITYSSYLAVVPGQILNDLYLEYGSKLLEGNVRSFLSVRGKVNKSIQNTIKNYPEMFFAYNNGIAATASELDTEMTSNGPVITRIKDLQIVNGGQTTASIANTLLTAKKGETIDISSLYVPMKVSVLEHSMSERIIPKISEYSNSQNKVDASDFFSNHPFHIRMEEYSRKIPAPAVHGNQYNQFWFYERTRGQYNQGKMKFKAKSAQLREYETRYPENQVIKMVDLAKYMEIYLGNPDKVSKGKQAIVKVFAEQIKKDWVKSDKDYNDYYFKRVVALAIMFKSTDDIIKQTDWYKEKHSYKANVIAYTMSIIFNYIRTKKKGFDIDFLRIWNSQELYTELSNQLRILCTEVYKFITRDDRGTENVTEWCKREACWESAKKERWPITSEFLSTLVSASIDKKEAKTNRDVMNDVDLLKTIMAYGSDYWMKVLLWGNKRHLLASMEETYIRQAVNIQITGKTPSVKAAKIIMRARERLIEEGMPLQL